MTQAVEQVLVAPTAVFHALGVFQGFTDAITHYLPRLLEEAHYMPRPAAEDDPGYKQLISYVIFRCGEQVFHYTRGKAGAEARLRALRSIGVGGHICDADGGCSVAAYRAGMLREVREELVIDCPYQERAIGLINDDRTPVGQVHLGVVHVFDLSAPAVRRRERVLAHSGFAPLAELRRDAERFETWSQFLLRPGLLDA